MADLAIVRMIAGATDGYEGGATIRINEIDMSKEEIAETPTSAIRRTYTQSLDSLRAVGVAVQSGTPVSLEATATSVRDLIRQGMPALPIELSKEEDAQLVQEGVLPPGE